LPEFYMVGQQTTSYTLTSEGGLAGIFGAALQPGTIATIAQQPAYLFTNTPADTASLFPPGIIQPFISLFKKAKDHYERLDIVIRFYRQFNIQPRYEVYREALQLIYRHKGVYFCEGNMRQALHQRTISAKGIQATCRYITRHLFTDHPVQ